MPCGLHLLRLDKSDLGKPPILRMLWLQLCVCKFETCTKVVTKTQKRFPIRSLSMAQRIQLLCGKWGKTLLIISVLNHFISFHLHCLEFNCWWGEYSLYGEIQFIWGNSTLLNIFVAKTFQDLCHGCPELDCLGGTIVIIIWGNTLLLCFLCC